MAIREILLTTNTERGSQKQLLAFILPVFGDLSSCDLLSKYLYGRAQNVNECLKKFIRDR